MDKFAGKAIIVTGGAGGIGAAIAHAFAAAGARVAVLDIHVPADAEKIPGAVYCHCDVSKEESVEQAFTTALGESGRIDVVVHAAALLGRSGPFPGLTLATWQSYIDVNLTGSFLVCRAAATRMIQHEIAGRIVLIGSVNSFAAEPEAAPYVAAKGGVRLLTRAAAVDLAGYGITVNMIAPGPITTPANRETFNTQETRDIFARALPVGKAGEPRDIAAAALFLASPESYFITGTDIVVDGGMFAQIAI